jgi:hypothetical protein
MLHCVALVRTDVSEELSTPIIRVTRICELGTMLAITSNRSMLRRNASQKTAFFKRKGYLKDIVSELAVNIKDKDEFKLAWRIRECI